ncbi:MAG: 4Fe-4S binding protein [Verrucomicrobia bacterium]|nr:4Fe-4S binding protein [Verrucomicrobiota bacterium]
MNNVKAISRRDLFSGFLRRAKNIAHPKDEIPEAKPVEARVAIVQGRFCLAYQKSFCSTCIERCPVEGAITLRDNYPMVNAELCNGCGICHELCPAPRNAILMMPKRPPVA